jgi:tRNA (cmo5U34)-methyltransferase
MPAMRDNQTAHAARDYDAEITRTVPHYETIQVEVLDLVRAVQPSPPAWLDTGCGTGRFVERALPLFPSTRFLLVDPSEAMLAQAQKRIGADERVTWLPPTGTQGIAPPPSPPDVITAILCHHYLRPDEREGCLAHCHQLLSKGGLLVSVEIVAPATDRGRSLGLERWRRFQTEHDLAGGPPCALAARGLSGRRTLLARRHAGRRLRNTGIGEHAKARAHPNVATQSGRGRVR